MSGYLQIMEWNEIQENKEKVQYRKKIKSLLKDALKKKGKEKEMGAN